MGIQLVPPIMEARTLIHWTAREVPRFECFEAKFPNLRTACSYPLPIFYWIVGLLSY